MSRTLVAQNRGQNKSRFLAKVFDVSSIFNFPKLRRSYVVESLQFAVNRNINGILTVSSEAIWS